MKTLLIDTSDQVLSIAITDDIILAEININIKRTHSETLMPYISQLLKMTNLKKSELECIVVSNGPGSYTGVRIGVTVAKTLAVALNIPIFTVSSLFVMAASFRGVVAPVIDARRGNIYGAVYELDGDSFVTLKEPVYLSFEEFNKSVMEMGATVIANTSLKQNFEGNMTHVMSRIGNVVNYMDALNEVDAHSVVPDYLRISEAERNWIESTSEK
ncbi:tRNA (adenosine(37)-N6)-threonylcarbamoyltransferase complex dimerization subunit type 1 TsaB [Phocicoccus pinnipedialis]|uniref:tRNA threonylcarbamoyladenosine biosynthesis protein TsaB n=1 Tax=Phocicoccus pinnipedialis TaxID=110845 RepID=A0A6V7R864_9BACL|nr:tRNA (adenosine(37)-N6)-threonylcarbamoyltransferase complex dimerization subunit type 1 TsaB [Jeotgalicoccus pinnipedialis]MBP1940128.1 tRNA threonylcarbamoyladenosine biosynthesis protein TsaB [Jeotgalicoccus pinnipedialis]CAD2073670.1 tRNA threonylcarbamoyladenosine biosynthesis protein TsaB [Jeotgalicoccus pinnipedialis]